MGGKKIVLGTSLLLFFWHLGGQDLTLFGVILVATYLKVVEVSRLPK